MKRLITVIMILIVVIAAGIVPQEVYSADEEDGIKLTKEDLKLLTPQERAFFDELEEHYNTLAEFYTGLKLNIGRPFYGGVDEIAECRTWFLEHTPVCIINSAPIMFEGERKKWNSEVCASLENLKKKIVSQYGYLMENWDSPDTRAKWESEWGKYYTEYRDEYFKVREMAEDVTSSTAQLLRELLKERKKLREKAKPVIEEAKDIIKEDIQKNKDNDKNAGSSEDSEDLFDTDCFIATAAYGTRVATEIDTLRQFRDEFLLHNYPGRIFVDVYYATSPPVAWFISEHEVLRLAVREGFVDPVVTVVELTESWWEE